MRWVRKPDQVLADTKTAEGAYASALSIGHPSTLLRMINPMFLCDLDASERAAKRRELQVRPDQTVVAAVGKGRDRGAATMPAVDLLMLTSQNEGMPNVWMEALAAGAPVVALALLALHEWDYKVSATAGGHVLSQAPRGDREMRLMADAVRRVINSAPRRDLIASGPRDVLSKETGSSQLAECVSGIEWRIR
jgi:hypothetical protein